jgi:hypothetical protein
VTVDEQHDEASVDERISPRLLKISHPIAAMQQHHGREGVRPVRFYQDAAYGDAWLDFQLLTLRFGLLNLEWGGLWTG